MNTILITGGAGFIGCHSVFHFAKTGWKTTVIDDLSRKGAAQNLEWLRSEVAFDFHQVDIRDYASLASIVKAVQPDVVLHLAGQVAVTTSVADPRTDFEINAVGTFLLLESVRLFSPQSFFINASTNKVYGRMSQVAVCERNGRYEFLDLPNGVNESQPLDFYSPYGCSKGIADQYVLDYSRIYGLKTTSFRQSCIYGTRQFGVEDQGWVAWFCIATILNKPITIFGTGKQIRDVLYVEDLLKAYQAAIDNVEAASGKAFNIGGGSGNTMSLHELISFLESELHNKLATEYRPERPGDQPVFVCDVSRAWELLRWSPQVTRFEGVQRLLDWTSQHRELVAQIVP